MNNKFSTTPNIIKLKNNRITYKFVPREMRHRLIEMVEIEKVPIKEASEILQINKATAKSIVRLFKMTGRIDIKARKIISST